MYYKINILTSSDLEIKESSSFRENTDTTNSKQIKKVAPVVYTNGISALAYIAAGVNNDVVYLEHSSAKVLPVASMSKLVTAFAATDILSASTSITITELEAKAPPDGSGIRENETYSLGELLYPLLLNSSNIAAEALASSTMRSEFLELMSSYAWEIGMSTAHFADPSGVSPQNKASSRDLLALARYLYKFRPDILALTRNGNYSVSTTTDHDAHQFTSTHPFVADKNFLGGKTGRTPEAGDTMMTIMNINSVPVAIIVLGSNYGERGDDTKRIIDLIQPKVLP